VRSGTPADAPFRPGKGRTSRVSCRETLRQRKPGCSRRERLAERAEHALEADVLKDAHRSPGRTVDRSVAPPCSGPRRCAFASAVKVRLQQRPASTCAVVVLDLSSRRTNGTLHQGSPFHASASVGNPPCDLTEIAVWCCRGESIAPLRARRRSPRRRSCSPSNSEETEPDNVRRPDALRGKEYREHRQRPRFDQIPVNWRANQTGLDRCASRDAKAVAAGLRQNAPWSVELAC
jgi:hypothetical protein